METLSGIQAARIDVAEKWTAVALTALLVALHVLAATSAGALWRDEAGAVGVATLPRLNEVWRNLPHEAFPILWVLIVRGLAAVAGPMNDPAFRAFALAVGVSIVVMIWLNARGLSKSYPLISLALFAMNPNVIRWGDSMRGYGLGLLAFLVAAWTMWLWIRKPAAAHYVAATIAAVASVHVLLYNAVELLAVCSAAFVVLASRGSRKNAVLSVLTGIIAAVSLLPYLPVFRSAAGWNAVVRMPSYTIRWFWEKIGDTINAGGAWLLAVWCIALGIAIVWGASALIVQRSQRIDPQKHDVVLFCLVALLVGIPANFLFLRVLSYYTAPWYYFALLALVAVSIEGIFGSLIRAPLARAMRLVIVITIVALSLVNTERLVKHRMTNIDLIAAKISSVEKPDDLVLVAPWHYGLTFNRYYSGNARWMTVPVMDSLRFHHYEDLAKLMHMSDQTAPARRVTAVAAETLREGHRVFVVGELSNVPRGGVKVLPSAPWPGGIWNEGKHEQQWSMMLNDFLIRHATSRTDVPVEVMRVVSPYERATLTVMQGWKP